MVPTRIISGGQTGADRGGLDAAIALGIPHGGWCPKGRLAEDSKVPARYQLTETGSRDYPDRTRRNVLDADATVIFTLGSLDGGSRLTADLAQGAGKPWVHLNLKRLADRPELIDKFRDWLVRQQVATLNIAGSRESKARGIQKAVAMFLEEALGSTMLRTRGGAYVVESEESPGYGNRVIDVVDGVEFVDVTSRDRNPQVLGGVHPPKRRR